MVVIQHLSRIAQSIKVVEEKTIHEDKSEDGWVNIFEFPEGNLVKRMNFGSTVNELFFNKEDDYLLAVGHKAVKVYKTVDCSLAQTLSPGYFVTFTSGVFSPDAEYVAAVGQGGTSRGTVFLWKWKEGKLIKHFNHTGKKIESISWHPNGKYIAYAGHNPHIFIYRVSDIFKFNSDQIPVASKVWASDNAEYIDFNTDGSSAHQNGFIKLWVWIGENSNLNEERHEWVKSQQSDAKNK